MSLSYFVVDPTSGEVDFGRRLRRPYSRERLKTVIDGPSKTQQSFKEECDVNRIIDRFSRTGVLPSSKRVPYFADVVDLQVDITESFVSSVDVINRANTFLTEYFNGSKPAEPVPAVVPENKNSS